jgi:hypothetical protein
VQAGFPVTSTSRDRNVMRIIDNINAAFGDDLKSALHAKSRLKIAASCFSIYAWETLKAELSKIEALEFIFTAAGNHQYSGKRSSARNSGISVTLKGDALKNEIL